MIQRVLNKLSYLGTKVNPLTVVRKYNFGYAVGDPHENHIAISTFQLLRNKTEEHPNSIALNSYDQNVTFTYQ